MERKLKFKPKVTRIKLNPEQAVLSCTCYDGAIRKGHTAGNSHYSFRNSIFHSVSTGAFCDSGKGRYSTPRSDGNTALYENNTSSS